MMFTPSNLASWWSSSEPDPMDGYNIEKLSYAVPSSNLNFMDIL